jgi:hypothetical protein
MTTGLILHKDPRDSQYEYKIVTGDKPPFKQKEWWDNGWWGDQGKTPYCGAYSWLHLLEDGPVFQDNLSNKSSPMFSPETFYKKCKEIDGVSGEGTTIHAGAKIAKSLGLIREYRWIDNVEDAVIALLVHGPVIAGTHWYVGMEADSSGRMHVSGASNGGHAYIINGVDEDKQTFRIKNSYGKKWGKNGHGYISFKDMQKLFDDGGTLCVPFVEQVESLSL